MAMTSRIARQAMADDRERQAVHIRHGETQGLFEAGHDQPESTLIAVIGESGCLEIEIVGVSASIMLGVREGEKVSVRW